MSDLELTALYDLHVALGARMVPFAGYQMPLHYADGIIAEHLHCRERAAFFDISHMGQCFIHDEDAAARLEELTPASLMTMETGRQRYTVLTNDQGGIVDDIVISRLKDAFMIVVNAACKDKDFAILKNHFGGGCDITPDRALIALQGPAAIEIIQLLAPPAAHLKFMQILYHRLDAIDCLISRSGYTGEDGFEISVAAEDAAALAELLLSFAQVKPAGLGARDTLRLEAGLSLYGHELDETITPVEAGLGWLISSNNVRFPGQEIIHRQLEHGCDRIRIGLLAEGKIPVREQSELFDENDKQVGITTSGGFSPTLKRPVAMALIDASHGGSDLYGRVRNRRIKLVKTALPFVPHRFYRG